jgi:hypothetical protein
LQAEADSLEEILKNQAHPKNLVAVKKSGTPVVSAPSLNAKPQFLASIHDEFELLDFNAVGEGLPVMRPVSNCGPCNVRFADHSSRIVNGGGCCRPNQRGQC